MPATAIRERLSAVPAWSLALPVLSIAVLAGIWGHPVGWTGIALVSVALVAAVFAAVHHAEVIALRVGEPFGTLILALAVTIIEASLIVTLMVTGGDAASALARDTVFAAVMIICNGVVGVCLLLGAFRHRVLAFKVEGTTPALAALSTLVVLTLVLPSFTTTTPGPTLSHSQLVFAGIVSVALYSFYVFVQTMRHRDYFLPVGVDDQDSHAEPATGLATLVALGMLFVALVAVVGLAKSLAPSIENAVRELRVPHAVVGVVVALLVLLPETVAAARAALRNRMQTSFNLALGSALATIALTIPVVAAASLALGLPLALGLSVKNTAFLMLTLFISSMTLAQGRATVLQGAVHLVLFAVFLFLAVVP
jgi:Ca2+:H+ antiporter